MGDGRYYTYYQFYNIVFLTLLAMFLLVSMVTCFYKNTKTIGSKQVAVVFMLMTTIVIARIIEQVVVLEYMAYYLRYIEIIFLVIVLVIFIDYLIKHVTLVNDELSRVWTKLMTGLSFVLIGFMTVDLLMNRGLIIESYSFFNVEYTKIYSSLIIFIAMIFFIISIKLKEYANKYIAFLIVLTCAIFLALYSFAINVEKINIDMIELMLYLFLSIGLNMFVDSFIPYSTTTSMLPNIKDIILDYVFVLDSYGDVIYKNNKVEESSIFKSIAKIDVKNVGDLFKGYIESQTQYNKNYIKLGNENKIKYFSFVVKSLSNKGENVGSILTFTDISNLINMLETLREQQKNSEKINNELSQYSKIVYRLEKEREVSVLLEEIAKTQESSLLKLKSEISLVLLEENNEKFQEDIELMIKSCKGNLTDVRNAVSTYMEYYGGRND